MEHSLEEVKLYLEKFKSDDLDAEIPHILSKLKKQEVEKDNQEKAKEIWCIETVYSIINHYLSGFRYLKEERYFDGWCEYERAEIGFSFLRRHFDYSGNKYKLEFIEDKISKIQKLFPYKYFMSRETIIKKARCSICNHILSLRNSCGHKIGDIYNGEMCSRVIEEAEFLGTAIVTNPFDKYTVLFPKGLEYNYDMIKSLILQISSPYEDWDLKISKDVKEHYRGVGRNQLCPCGSQKKFKKCCYKTGDYLFSHYRILLHNKPETYKTPVKLINTWKDN